VVDVLTGVPAPAALVLVGRLATCGVLDDPHAVSPIATIMTIAVRVPSRRRGNGVVVWLSAAVVFIAPSSDWCADRCRERTVSARFPSPRGRPLGQETAVKRWDGYRAPEKERSMRVLVIEDDEELADTVAAGLRDARMAVDVARDGRAGLARARVTDYDVIVLDRDLPVLHGDEVCAQLVAAGGRSRVLMLTGAAENEDLVEGLGLGADDYLPKPFAFAVLVARIGALARRAQPGIPPVLEHRDLVLDTGRLTAHRGGRPLALRPKEFGVLELLLSAHGRVVSPEELLERVWDEAADPFTGAVKITISRLRSKLGDPPLIQTVARAGYRI
jgi:DNA-binding response OmpR family regulator